MELSQAETIHYTNIIENAECIKDFNDGVYEFNIKIPLEQIALPRFIEFLNDYDYRFFETDYPCDFLSDDSFIDSRYFYLHLTKVINDEGKYECKCERMSV